MRKDIVSEHVHSISSGGIMMKELPLYMNRLLESLFPIIELICNREIVFMLIWTEMV